MKAARSFLNLLPPDYDPNGAATYGARAGQVAALAASIRQAIQASADAGDPTTADLFTEVSRALDKDLWFLEAHLQGR